MLETLLGGTTLFSTIDKHKAFQVQSRIGTDFYTKKWRLGSDGEIIGGVSHPHTPLICAPESGSETVHKKDISNAMNSFFCSVGKDLADKIDPAPNPLLAGYYEINKPKATFHFRAIEGQEIRDAFATVKTAKSFGTDNISSYFLKLALPFIENSLAFLFNTSIETSCFPDS